MITKEITEKQFKGMLRNHDWYYGKSNDNRIFNKGKAQDIRISDAIENNPELQKIYDDYKEKLEITY